MTLNFRGQPIETTFWKSQHGKIAECFALDTETSLIEKGKIPPFVIGQAYGGGCVVYLIRLNTLAAFMDTHHDCTLIMHNAPFDVSVIHQEIDFNFDLMIRSQRLFDTSIMFRLWNLATVGELPKYHRLDFVAKELLGVSLDKDEDIRCGFGRHRDGTTVNYEAMTELEIAYAAQDSLATFQIFQVLDPKIRILDPDFYLSHKIQFMGAVAIAAMSRRGIGIHHQRRTEFLNAVDRDIKIQKKKLGVWGYRPGEGQKGIEAHYEEIIKSLGIDLPKTATGKSSSTARDLESYREEHPFIDAFLGHKEKSRLKQIVEKFAEDRIHTKFTDILKTGRTSSKEPPLQNLPKKANVTIITGETLSVRDLFAPAPGHKFIIADYSQLELCTLAQVCIAEGYGSKMAEFINADRDIHRGFASLILGKPECEIDDAERQKAKACNFGFPGGLGAGSFLEYARDTFGVTNITADQAKVYRETWLNAFPEMRHYLADPILKLHDFSIWGAGSEKRKIAYNTFRRIASGETKSKKTGKPYDGKLINWALNIVMAKVAPEFVGIRKGSSHLWREIQLQAVATLTGRIRARAEYCEAKNFPMQALASDGVKIALYRLDQAGIPVVNCIHDELISEVNSNLNIDAIVKEKEQIMIESMNVVVPDVKIKVKIVVADRWVKP